MITLEIKDAEVSRALTELRALLDDLSLVMNDIGQYLVLSAKDRLLAGQSVDGTPLAPRAASTLAAYDRRKQKPGPHPLWLEGDMRRGIHHAFGRDHVSVGSGAIQSAVMQFGAAQGAFGRTRRGGPIPWGRIPPRPFLGVSEADRSELLDIVSEAILAAVRP